MPLRVGRTLVNGFSHYTHTVCSYIFYVANNKEEIKKENIFSGVSNMAITRK